MTAQKHIVVLTGAGISAESGLKTFRDANGLWEGHDLNEVATPEGWRRNPELVLEFYNERRRALRGARPNPGHTALAELEKEFKVTIITQNVDDLHERAGSTCVVHLHGELLKSQSTVDPELVYPVQGDIKMGDLCEKGSQLRPAVVWFGEAVPKLEEALPLVEEADGLMVVGTSLVVYPAAGLIHSVQPGVPRVVVDPAKPPLSDAIHFIAEKASVGVPLAIEFLRKRI